MNDERSILIVDEEPDTRDLLARALRQEGYAVFTAGDGTEAWKLMQGLAIDMVILDVMLPGMNAAELRRWMREDPLAREVPVITTSRGRRIDRVGGLDDETDDFIVKPFDVPGLAARVAELFRRCPPRTRQSQILRAGGVVLVVDDEAPVRRLLARVLRDVCPDYSVAEAADVPEAKSALADLRPRLVITDVRLPSGNGSELCHFIQGHPWLYKTKVLIITGYPSARLRDEVFSEGASEFLPKPFHTEELAESVSRLLM